MWLNLVNFNCKISESWNNDYKSFAFDSYEEIKTAISNDCLLQFYDVSCPLMIECGASKKGLGCILLLAMDKNITDQDISDFSEKEMEVFLKHLRPVAYSCKSLSDAKT